MLDRESATKVDKRVQEALFIFAIANSVVNPLIYGTFRNQWTNGSSTSNCCYHSVASRRKRRLSTTELNGTHYSGTAAATSITANRASVV